ncbi:MAG: hypothetical protein IJF74_06065 [Clostridia bacterium]|nr:hypothetical protein [Clostridia bacterium]
MPGIKKRLCAAIMLCAASLSLSSCLIVVNKPEETTAPVTTEAPATDTAEPQVTDKIPQEEKLSENEKAAHRLSSMLDYDMDGKTIILVTTDSNVPLPVGSTRILDKTRWQILNEVSEKYGAELIVTRETRSKMLSKFLEASTAGLYYADILCTQSSEMGSLFAEKLVADMSSLPFLDFDAEYYYQMAAESVTVNGSIYGVAGQASVDFDTFGCAFVNLDVLNEIGADVYADVEGGGWTYDRLLEYVRLYEYSEDGTYKQRNALSSDFDKGIAAEYLFEALGTRYVYSDNGELKLYTPDGSAAEAVKAVRALCYAGNWGYQMTDEEEKKYFEEQMGDPSEFTQLDLMLSGKGLFCFGTLNDLARVYYSKTQIVPIPMPKLNKEQGGYITPTAGEAGFFFIPADGANITESAILIEALNARSYGAIKEAYITNALHYYARNEKTLDMIGIIAERPYFDLAVNFGNRYGALKQVAQKTAVAAAENDQSLQTVYGAAYAMAEEALAEIKAYAEQ